MSSEGTFSAIVRNAISKAQADAEYLKLDCSNDPLTDTLQGENFTTVDPTELVTNGDFVTSANWTFGGSWQWNAGQYAEIPGTLTLSGNLTPTPAVSITVGRYYLLTFDINNSRSFVRPSCGGWTGEDYRGVSTQSTVFLASSTANLNFYGEVDGVGRIGKLRLQLDNVSLKELGYVEGYMKMLGAELSGHLLPTSAGASDIGEDALGIRRIYLDDTLTAQANPLVSGLICQLAGGEILVGNDNIFPGYYVQKTIVAGSTAADNSDDYTNLYQGDAAYQAIAMMYAIEHSASPQNGVNLGDGTTEPPAFIHGGLSDVAWYMRLNPTNNKYIMKSTNDAYFLEIGLAGVDPAIRPDTDGLIDLGDSNNTLRWRHLYLTGNAEIPGTARIAQQLAHLGDADTYVEFTDDQIDLVAGAVAMLRLDETTQDVVQVNPGAADVDFEVYGDTGLVIQSDAAIDGLGFFGATPVAQPAAYTPTNVTTDRSYDANSTTIDEIADVLGTLIADLQSLGLVQ